MIYTMSDIHGCLKIFEKMLSLVDLSEDNKLILLGDYIHRGPDSVGVLDKVISLQKEYGSDKVIAFMGNHEELEIDDTWSILTLHEEMELMQNNEEIDMSSYIQWMKKLPRYHVEDNLIFVHAGIEEEAEDLWKHGTPEYVFTQKYPAQTGHFYEDYKIIAGHVGTSEIAHDKDFHDIYYDGESHYYIDGSTYRTGILPLLAIDTKKYTFCSVTESGFTSVE